MDRGHRDLERPVGESIAGVTIEAENRDDVACARLVDGRASYGISLATFALGFPLHFDWSWKTLMNRDWEDVEFARYGGSPEFRKVKFTMWIGYDW